MGTVVGVGQEAGLLDEEGRLPGADRVLLVDSVAAMAGGAASASSATTYIESAAGVGDGARTGLASVVTGVLFLGALLVTPLVTIVPFEAASPALVIVGFLLLTQIRNIDFDDYTIAIPAFLTIVLMPFTYSITNGIGAGFVAYAVLMAARGRAREAFDEGRRLNDSMGSVIILPQLLASLGVIFVASKVGDLIAEGIKGVIPAENLFLLVAANCLGMTLFTLVMGNSFAAFPVITAGVLVPLIIKPFGVDPAMAAIVTLTTGSTGTLMTPMAANFNIVPAALLGMRDQYAVIKFQVPFALTMWVLHVLVLWLMIRLL